MKDAPGPVRNVAIAWRFTVHEPVADQEFSKRWHVEVPDLPVLPERRPVRVAYALLVSVVRSTADAAEHVARLMLVRRGLRPTRTHDLEALARQLQFAEPGRWANQAECIGAMKGENSQHHKAACTGVTPGDVRHAADRMQAFSRTVSEEFQETAPKPCP